jgi:hypothetical protein
MWAIVDPRQYAASRLRLLLQSAQFATPAREETGFMKYRIVTQDGGISIQIDDVLGQEAILVQKIRQCRQSAWACPSGECLNVGSIDERIEEGRVFLTLTPRPGAQLNLSGIEECLSYMLHQTVKA